MAIIFFMDNDFVNNTGDCAELLYNAMDSNLRQETILEALNSDEFLSFVHNELIPGFSKDAP